MIGTSSTSCLPAMADIVNSLITLGGLISERNEKIQSNGDLSILRIGVNDAAKGMNSIAETASKIAKSINSGESLNCLNERINDWNVAFSAYNSALASTNGTVGSIADVNDYASSLYCASKAAYDLSQAIEDGSSDAVAFAKAANYYGLISLIDGSNDPSDSGAIIRAVANNSAYPRVFNNLANAFDAFRDSVRNLSVALSDAATKSCSG